MEGFERQSITPTYTMVDGKELCSALQLKLVEEAHEVSKVVNRSELISELADVLEVIDGLCKAYGIDSKEIAQVKRAKLQEKGGFEKGVYIKTISMADDNQRVSHFRSSPDKYPEV